MANQSTGGDKRIDRRTVLQVGTALAATGATARSDMPKRSNDAGPHDDH